MMVSAMFDVGINLIIFTIVCFLIVVATFWVILIQNESKKADDEVKKMIRELEERRKRLLGRKD